MGKSSKKVIDCWGTLLPGGNQNEFPLIEKELKARKVKFRQIKLSKGGMVFVFNVTEKKKLPTDDMGPYLPVLKDSGHSIYRIYDKDIEQWKENKND